MWEYDVPLWFKWPTGLILTLAVVRRSGLESLFRRCIHCISTRVALLEQVGCLLSGKRNILCIFGVSCRLKCYYPPTVFGSAVHLTRVTFCGSICWAVYRLICISTGLCQRTKTLCLQLHLKLGVIIIFKCVFHGIFIYENCPRYNVRLSVMSV